MNHHAFYLEFSGKVHAPFAFTPEQIAVASQQTDLW